MGNTVQICDCGTDHSTIKASPSLFLACQLIGFQTIEADDFGPGEVYELRNCAAGGTMNLLVWSSDASDVSADEVDALVAIAREAAAL